MSTTRRLPANLDAEASVLGGVILSNEALARLGSLRPDDFYDPRNREVFTAIKALEARSRPIDPVTLEEELSRTGKLAAIGGMGFLSEIVDRVPTVDNIAHYAEIVADKAIARRLITTASEVMARAYGEYSSAPELVEEARRLIVDFAERNQTGTLRYGAESRELLGDDEPPDDGSEWLVPGILAAEAPGAIVGSPKAKKSFVMLNLALAVAAGVPAFGRFQVRRGRVLMLEREDGLREVRRRLWRVARGMNLDPRPLMGEWLRIDVRNPIYLDNPAHVSALRATLTEWGPSAVFLDSLKRVHRADENSAREMSPVTEAWAGLAREFKCAVVCLHHLRKLGAKGDDGDLGARMRGSGDLFALVRHVLGVDRPPEKEKALRAAGVSVVSSDGNLPGQVEPFSMVIRDGFDDVGKKTIEFEVLDESEVDELKGGASVEAAKANRMARQDGDDQRVLAYTSLEARSQEEIKMHLGRSGGVAKAIITRLLNAGELTSKEVRRPNKNGALRRVEVYARRTTRTDADNSDEVRAALSGVSRTDKAPPVGGPSVSPARQTTDLLVPVPEPDDAEAI